MESSDGLLPHSLSLSPLSIYPRQPRQYRKKKPVPRTKGGLLTLFLVCGARALQVPSHTDTHTPTRAAVGFFSFCFFVFFLFFYFRLGTQRCLFVFSPPFACLLADGWMDDIFCLFQRIRLHKCFTTQQKEKKKQKNGPYLKVEINICSYHYHHNARHNNNNTVTRNERKKTNLQTCRIFKQDKTNIGGDKNKQKK